MRARVFVAILLLAAAGAMPLAFAARGKSGNVIEQVIPSPAARDAIPVVAQAPYVPASALPFLSLVIVASAGVLAIGAWAAHRSTVARIRRPPRRSFEAGRVLGRAQNASSTSDAADRLACPPAVLRLVSITPRDAGLHVVVVPKRARSCELVAGFLTGLFETAWAANVVVRESCGAPNGQPCAFDVLPARGARAVPGRR